MLNLTGKDKYIVKLGLISYKAGMNMKIQNQ